MNANLTRRGALIFSFVFMTSLGVAQDPSDGRGPPNPPQGAAREAMWPAPTAVDWKKPVLITFQRTWKDAVEVSKQSNKPILVCINMDGEIASEHYAGVRYRQPEIAKLYEPYVCVIASVYRHNPRDFDDQGRRILCPRFGSVTCGEHIWIEPIIFEKFCDGRRVAPRHIALDMKQKETYDIYYRNDTKSVFEDVRDQVPEVEGEAKNIVRGDRPVVERVTSRHVKDREAVESAYRSGDKSQRQALLEAALKAKEAEQLGLLRLAIFGLDPDLSASARSALTGVQTSDAADLIAEALQIQMPQDERDKLLAALKNMGKESVRAQWLAGVSTGLSAGSGAVKLEGWSKERAGAEYPAPKLAFGGYGHATHTEDKARAVEQKPQDAGARLDLAEASLAQAMKAPRTYADNPRMARLAAAQLYTDAKKYAAEAEKLGAPKWRVRTVLALSAFYSGNTKDAYAESEAAVKELPAGEPGWATMAVVTIFAESRWKGIQAAVRKGENWPPAWLSDLDSAYRLLLRHPLGTDSQVAWHYEFLDWLGARRRASNTLREGIERFRSSPKLHRLYRARILKFRGPAALERAYESMLDTYKDPARIEPFAGVAAVNSAEHYRRIRNFEKALEAYGRAIEHYGKGVAADARNSPPADRAVSLAHAGRARVAYQLKNDALAFKEIMASFDRNESTAGDRDGMGITPGETAQMLLQRLEENGKTEEAKQLTSRLRKINPELLRPDRGLEEPK
ncbi:MAG: ATP-binding protein [Planctomycetota bacterium]|jgi:tetratricopeptide (TPR) repeat protein